MGSKSSVCRYSGGYLREGAVIIPRLAYPVYFPVSKCISISGQSGSQAIFGRPSLDRLGLGYKSGRLRNLLNLIQYRIGRKGNKRPCKQAPSKLAWIEGKLPVLFTPYSLLSTRCNTSQLNIYSLITQYPEVVDTSNPYSLTLAR